MNVVKLNTISLNTSPLNAIGEVKMSGASGGGGGGGPIEKPIGVFIYTADGKFITSDDWDTANNDKAVGVFVNDGEHDFVIAKQNASTSLLRWGGQGKTITSIPEINSKNIALLDFNGADNTSKIIAELEEYNDTYVTGAPAAEACVNLVFPNGKNGYLPALGEWNLAYVNKTAVTNAMKKCGGVTIKDYYWSSTQYHESYSWRLGWDNGAFDITTKNHAIYVRAFCKI